MTEQKLMRQRVSGFSALKQMPLRLGGGGRLNEYERKKNGYLFQKLMIERRLSISLSTQLEALPLQVSPISGDRLREMFLGLAIGDALGKTMAVSIPMSFTVLGERKLVVFPYGSELEKPRHRIENTMVKALGRAFRWQRPLESGQSVTAEEIATAENINTSYISRILKLTLLYAEIVEVILDGRQPTAVTLKSLQKGFLVCSKAQRPLLK